MKTLKTVFFIGLLLGLTKLITAQTASELLLQAEDFEDQQLSLTLSQQALDLATKANDKNSIISAKTFIALAYFYQNRIDEGETFMNEALQMAANNTDLLVQYRCWNIKGALNYFKADFEQGIVCFEKAYSYALKMGDAYYNMDALISLAECNLKAGHSKLPSTNVRRLLK
jgi:tetratricopeptide (TPR) repeat protein